MLNAIGRNLPESVDGYGAVKPFAGAFAARPEGRLHAARIRAVRPGENKILSSLEEVFRAIPVRDGMTLSFHHHLRNGDQVLNMVLDTAAKLGIGDLTVAMSSVFPIHAPLVGHFATGTVTGLDTNYMTGPVAQAISRGALARPAILRSHGGRARAVETGELTIDVAFIAAPAADPLGNLSGSVGPTACGSLGYAVPDSEHAEVVVAVTDHLAAYPLFPVSIPQTRVDHVVVVDRIGDPQGIAFGTTALTRNPLDLKIAHTVARVIEAAGLIRDGFSFQTGAGGASLASAKYVREMMLAASVTGGFALGGITAPLVAMLEEGLFRSLIDVQGFDLEAVRSLGSNPAHLEVGASGYASPFNAGCAVNQLDAVVLGATEIDVDFHVNVVTGSNGTILGGSGGHSDAAAGAGLTVVAAKLIRGRLPVILDAVRTVATPGETVDVLVTERGVAVNPRRTDLAERLGKAGLPLAGIEELRDKAVRLTGRPEPLETGDRLAAVVEYRDGTVIDTVPEVSPAG